MHRCALTAFAAVALLSSAQAQTHNELRRFPAQALRGELTVKSAPDVLINGQPARLSPGSRIKGENQLLVLPATVVGQKFVVNYTVDSYGLIQEVWVLTPAERAVQPWPTSPAEAGKWVFDANAQRWSKP
ncbi:MAG TPA: hypothetical protein VGE47_14595 [Burkholderiaceae bacterium]